jgi:hypothetical protein
MHVITTIDAELAEPAEPSRFRVFCGFCVVRRRFRGKRERVNVGDE